MNIITLISWSFVAFLMFNFYYSTKRYYKYYLEMRNDVRSGEADEQTIYNFGFMHFLPMILLQLFKLALIISIPLIVTSYNHKKELSEWTPEEIELIYDGCLGDEPLSGFTHEETESYCSCLVEKISSDVNYKKMLQEHNGEMPADITRQLSMECFEELGLMEKLDSLLKAESLIINKE